MRILCARQPSSTSRAKIGTGDSLPCVSRPFALRNASVTSRSTLGRERGHHAGARGLPSDIPVSRAAASPPKRCRRGGNHLAWHDEQGRATRYALVAACGDHEARGRGPPGQEPVAHGFHVPASGPRPTGGLAASHLWHCAKRDSPTVGRRCCQRSMLMPRSTTLSAARFSDTGTRARRGGYRSRSGFLVVSFCSRLHAVAPFCSLGATPARAIMHAHWWQWPSMAARGPRSLMSLNEGD
ncbi:uncharacterized protein CMC5_007350 [Chondromyces crocatus]|uniref:Uncharacterized protein n=1 Tax=Chondromyces crocatus TaxID=52 RepID=A0A0K1E6X7_CHOCO|nr:uncharacterized protein CMC5_007350 [Chondromyces crocatus]